MSQQLLALAQLVNKRICMLSLRLIARLTGNWQYHAGDITGADWAG